MNCWRPSRRGGAGLIYYVLIFAVLLFGVYKQPEFIYGRF